MRSRLSPFILTLLPMAVAVVGFSHAVRSGDLPRDESRMFSGSGNCATCHEPDKPDEPALRNSLGQDVSPPTFWRSTMMANAAKDPFWQAKVSAEVAANPSLKAAIEDKCTTCHAPMGRAEAILEGAPGYSLEEMRSDPLALDGVSCTVCHQIQPANLGTEESFSGGYQIEEGQTIFGPYESPVGWPMLALSGFEPRYGEHIGQSELCATCHTLFTNSVDAEGNVTGRLPEQTPYLEWLNSAFPAQDVECQTCHMPIEGESITVSNTPNRLAPRSPFYRHEFVGGNAFMLGLLRDNAEELGVTALPAHFDSTIARTRRMLGEESAALSAEARWEGDSLEVSVTVANLTGHKLPTGYPSRRMWLDLQVTANGGQVVFRSGDWDATGELVVLDAGLVPHQDVIRRPEQVQVYETVMGDAAGEVTYGLLRGAHYLKDNRILPEGWTDSGPWATETAPRGAAASDPDYNGREGSDRVRYRLGLPMGDYAVDIRLRYQTLAPRFAADLFGHATDEVQRFERMYLERPVTPERMDSIRLDVGSPVASEPGFPDHGSDLSVFPNPAHSHVTLEGTDGVPVVVHDLLGRAIRTLGIGARIWDLTDGSGARVPPGIYFLTVLEPGRMAAPSPVVVVR